MKQHPTFPAMSNRQADQTGPVMGSRERGSQPVPSRSTHASSPSLSSPPSSCINLSSRITSLFIRRERIKYFTRLQSILQGPSVDISNIYLTLLSHSLPAKSSAESPLPPARRGCRGLFKPRECEMRWREQPSTTLPPLCQHTGKHHRKPGGKSPEPCQRGDPPLAPCTGSLSRSWSTQGWGSLTPVQESGRRKVEGYYFFSINTSKCLSNT